MDKIQVTFRLLDDSVIALFPDEIWCGEYIVSYMRIGQHGGASKDLLTELPVASKQQYDGLLKELVTIYDDVVLTIVD